MKLKTQSEVLCYENDSCDYKAGEEKHIIVKSHWNDNDLVEIRIGTKVVWCCAMDLIKAINNATNT